MKKYKVLKTHPLLKEGTCISELDDGSLEIGGLPFSGGSPTLYVWLGFNWIKRIPMDKPACNIKPTPTPISNNCPWRILELR